MENIQPKRILILGGGFAGLSTAMELEKSLGRDSGVEVTMVNRENFFLFTPMLHEVAASDLDLTTIVNPARKMLRRTNFFAGEVRDVNLTARQVVVAHGFDHHEHTLEYDYLVLGLGSTTNFYGIPGLEERALTMKSLSDAIAKSSDCTPGGSGQRVLQGEEPTAHLRRCRRRIRGSGNHRRNQ